MARRGSVMKSMLEKADSSLKSESGTANPDKKVGESIMCVIRVRPMNQKETKANETMSIE